MGFVGIEGIVPKYKWVLCNLSIAYTSYNAYSTKHSIKMFIGLKAIRW